VKSVPAFRSCVPDKLNFNRGIAEAPQTPYILPDLGAVCLAVIFGAFPAPEFDARRAISVMALTARQQHTD